MSQSIICSDNFILFLLVVFSTKKIWEIFLEESLCFPHVNFTNLANYWDFFNFQKKIWECVIERQIVKYEQM